MLNDLRLEPRAEQHYLSILANMPLHEMRLISPKLRDEVFAWLDANGIEAKGAPFLKYRIINLERQWLRVEVGVPVVGGVEGEDRIQPGSFYQGCTTQRFLSRTLKGQEYSKLRINSWFGHNSKVSDGKSGIPKRGTFGPLKQSLT